MQNFLILLPLLNLLALIFVAYKKLASLRQGFLWGTTLFAFTIFVNTEILSIFNLLTFRAVLIFWMLFALVLFVFIFSKKISFKFFQIHGIDKLSLFFIVLLFVFLLLYAIIAIFQAPNNWDSMTYHLPKVMHWIQHQQVSHYATHIGRQVALNPMAEYLILHTILLTGNDYFANLIQFWAMMGTLVTASLIAQNLGANFRGQILAAFISLSIPILILEASSTQNDLVVSYFILQAIWSLMKLKESYQYRWAILSGLAVGLALLTKSIAYFYLGPWVLFFIIIYVKNRAKRLLWAGMIIVFLVLSINASFLFRNFNLFHRLIPEPDAIATIKNSVSNEIHNLKSFSSNIIRVFGYNLATTSPTYNRILLNNIVGAHRLLEFDINDKRTSFSNFELPFHSKFYSQDYAPNPAHTWLFLLMIPVLYISREKFSKSYFLSLFLGLSGFLLLIFMLKWQPFGTRFQIPFFVMVSIWVAIVLEKLFFVKNNFFEKFLYGLVLALSLFSAANYIYNSSNLALRGDKSLFSSHKDREELYFTLRPDLYQAYRNLVEEISEYKCKKIYMKLELDDWEYPIWRMLKNRKFEFEIYHKNVNNLTAPLENKNFKACGEIEINNAKGIAKFIKY